MPPNEGQGRSIVALWSKRAALALGLLFSRYPLLVQEFRSARMRDELVRLLEENSYDLVLVEHTLMAQYLENIPTSQPAVFSEHDARLAVPALPAQANEGQAGFTVDLREMAARVDRGKWRRYEARACRRAAIVLVPTEQDGALISRLVPGLQPVVVPFGIAPVEDRTPQTERDDNMVLFVGNFDHPPNVDAALWLAGEIMPVVWRTRPSARLWVVGRNPTPAVRALAGDRVTVTGEVPSVAPYLLRCSAFAAPVRQGAGIRMKVLEAMLHSAPVVTTPLGAQGLQARPGVDLLVAREAEEFAGAILQLLGDPARRETLAWQGYMLASSPEKNRERRELLNSVLAEAAGARPVAEAGSRLWRQVS